METFAPLHRLFIGSDCMNVRYRGRFEDQCLFYWADLSFSSTEYQLTEFHTLNKCFYNALFKKRKTEKVEMGSQTPNRNTSILTKHRKVRGVWKTDSLFPIITGWRLTTGPGHSVTLTRAEFGRPQCWWWVIWERKSKYAIALKHTHTHKWEKSKTQFSTCAKRKTWAGEKFSELTLWE